jgi:hypothetical protein
VFELVGEALDEIPVAIEEGTESGMFLRFGIGFMFAQAPRSARICRKASLS